ncbi:MAG: hypothetical protein JSV19_03850 [Phycisphaerales bacterium]|nr:MAG: hypothetical protein JSV19_03850 [Phycisphaerales bacterium]
MAVCAAMAWIVVSGGWHTLLLLPLALSVAVVYKTTRCDNLRDVPTATVALWATIVAGMFAVGIALWLVFSVCVVWTG